MRAASNATGQPAVPLSPGQDGLWLLQQLAPASGAYNNPLAIRLRGRLDAGLLQRCLDELAARHDALRLTFALTADGPVQAALPGYRPRLQVVDASEPDPHPDPPPTRGREISAGRVLELVGRESGRPFDLAAEPPVRAVLIRLAPDDHVFLLVLHHLVSDMSSMLVLLGELSALYSAYADGAPSPLTAPAPSYLDFVRWQHERLTPAAAAAHLDYWRAQLAGAPPVLELPTDRPRPRTPSFQGAMLSRELGPALTDGVRRLARERDSSPYMVLLAALQLLLARCSGQDDVPVGAAFTHRIRPRFRAVVGYLTNTLVMRTRLDGDPTFEELLARVRRTAIGAYAHAALPFERVVEALNPRRSASVHPLFQVLLSFFNEGAGARLDSAALDATSHRMADLAVELLPVDVGGARFDLTVCAHDTARGLGFSLEYSTDLFDPATVELLAGRLEALLEQAVRDPAVRLSDMDATTVGERRLLHEWNDTAAECPGDRCVHELFERQADRTPAAVALRIDGDSVTYGELEADANRLARRLRELGAGPESVVALLTGHSREAVVAMLAVLKAGAAYVAVDPCQPWKRSTRALRELGVRLLVAEDELADSAAPAGLRVVRLGAERAAIASLPATRPPRRARPRNLAFVIATSGTTGTPKGVGIEHAGAVSLLAWARRTYDREELAGVLAATSACFDCTLFELFAPLSWGGAAVLAPGPLDLPDLPAAGEVRVLSTVPAVMAELLERGPLPPSIQTVNLAGEPLPAALARRLHEEPGVRRVLNLYGPSEATTYATMLAVEPGRERMTVGRPIANTRAYVVDECLRRAPIGVPGELCLAGVGLARGYLGRPGETAARFVPDPFAAEPGARLYRTGDRARWLPGGELEYLGRLDEQVKVRGVRVEPAEVEQAIAAHPDVAEAAVVAERGADEGARLLAYVRPRGGRELTAAALRASLRDRLPTAMLPEAIVFVDAFPLTASGKVDRRALPRPETAAPAERTGPLATRNEEVLASIWAAVLGVDAVGRDDDFFDLGGHSLAAMRVVARVRETLGVELPLEAVFEASGLAAMAERIGSAPRVDAGPRLEPADRDAPLPLSFGQQRLWFLHELAPDDPAYHMPLQLRLRGRLDVAALERALDEVLRRHEVLRTAFDGDGGEPRQVVRPELRLPLTPLAVAGEAEAARLARAEAERPFDLAAGPLVRAALLRLGRDDHVLSLVVHHAVSDGWSLNVLFEELSALYGAFAAGRPSPLPEPRLQYADYASWQRRWLASPAYERELAYWKDRLAGAPPALELPTDHPRPALPTSRGGAARFKLRPAATAALRRLGRETDATLFATLLAGFQLLLARSSGQDDVLVGTPVAGRDRAELQSMLGFFVNTLVLRGDVAGNPSFRELLARTRTAVVGALAHRDLPFERLVDELDVPRDFRRTPLFQAMFALDGAMAPLRLEGLEVGAFGSGEAAAKFDLTLTVTDMGDFLAGRLDYRRDLFEPATARRLVRQLERLLEAAAADPDRGIRDLPLLGPRERERIVARGRGEAARRPESLVAAFERQAAARPAAVAVAAGDRRLTYGELERASAGLAGRLAALGVGPDVRVAVLARRRPELLVALLGVARAGGAAVPLDPGLPAERLAFIARDAGARVLVAAAEVPGALAALGLPVVRPDEAGGRAPGGPVPADALAYVLYTSGSTGAPKGVGVTAGGLAAYLDWATRCYPVGPGEGALAHSTIGADLTVTALLAPLAAGGVVELLDEDAGVEALAAALRAGAGRRLVKLTPTHLDLLPADLDAPPAALVVGGEQLTWDLADRWTRRWPQTPVFNEYGPTEATVACALYRLPKAPTLPSPAGRGGTAVPIGRPSGGAFVAVLDERMEPVPDGVVGMLYLGGRQVARGYLGRPAATAEAFVPDPFGAAGGRLYRSGDLARWRPDGLLELVGRADRQVKVLGHRVEPGEVEAVLRAHPDVREAAVEVRDGLLAAYVVAEPGREPALARHLRGRLPAHMVPASIVRLDALPTTASGKLDRRALPAPAGRPGAARALRPGERTLAGIWADVLGVPDVRPGDSFFDLGGSSYQALQVLRRIEDSARLVLPLADFLRHPTLEGLAEIVASRRPSRPWSPLVMIQAGDPAAPPLFVAPPLGGQSGYVELARALGRGRTVYGLECRGLYHGRPWRTVAAMAAAFAKAVRSARPGGPYLLCGYSFGAVLALETARRLRAASEPVGLVSMIDPPPARTEPPDREFDGAGFWAYLVSERLGLPFGDLVERLQAMDTAAQVEWTVTTLEAADRMPQDWRPLSPRRLRRALEVECTNAAAEWRHVVRPYDGDVVVIEAAQGATAQRRAEVRSWRAAVRGDVRIHEVASEHDMIVWERPAVSEVASILDGYMSAV